MSNVRSERHSHAVTGLDVEILLQSQCKCVAFLIELLVRPTLVLCFHGGSIGKPLNDRFELVANCLVQELRL